MGARRETSNDARDSHDVQAFRNSVRGLPKGSASWPKGEDSDSVCAMPLSRVQQI
jgi:hypothetical protein